MIDCGGAIILSHSELHSQNLMAHKFLLSLSGLTAHTIEFHSCIMLIMLNVFNIQPLCTYVLVRVTVVRNFPALTDWTVSRPEVHNSNVHLCESQYGASRWTNSLSLCYSLMLLWYKCAHYLRAHQHYPVAPTECDNKNGGRTEHPNNRIPDPRYLRTDVAKLSMPWRHSPYQRWN